MLQVPYLPLAPSLWLTVPSLALLGSGSAAVVVASYTSCLQAALATPGHAEAAATYSLGQLQHAPRPYHLPCHSFSVSGLHEAAYSLGNFTGPALAGLMDQKVSSGVFR